MSACRHGGGASVLMAVLLVTWVAGQAPPSPQQQPDAVFRAAAHAVSVDVSVQREGRPVTDLKATDFEILDNGVLQEITEITYERLPIDVTLLLDVSASVTGSPRRAPSCGAPGPRRSPSR